MSGQPISREESNPFSDQHEQHERSSTEGPFADPSRLSRGVYPSSRTLSQHDGGSEVFFTPLGTPDPSTGLSRQFFEKGVDAVDHLPSGIGSPVSQFSYSLPSTPSTALSEVDGSECDEAEREADIHNLPPLTVNITSSALAAEAIDPVLIEKGKRKVKIHKYLAIAFIFSLNFIMIFATWYWPRFYYLYLPLISLPLVLNCIMIFNVCVWSLKNKIIKPKKIIPERPEDLVLLMPCYNETFEECSKSLDSLVNQVNISEHKQAIMVICDGKVRGPGMEKSTADYLLQDIFTDQTERRMLRAAYVAWDGQSMDIEIARGMYKGIPFYCIVKQQNQGKRDSLIVVRSFVHNFNLRHKRPKVIFNPEFFKSMTDFLVKDAKIKHCELLIGMDADTVFATDCISHLVDESRFPGTVGVCGYVAVDFSGGNWNIWKVYQNAEYTIAQGLRRLHQSLCTKKVSCLPGCCQALRVCEETCGDFILVQEFGYHPKPTDGIIKRIRATASEDRNHVCLMLMTFPKAKTRQALKAYAFTDVPRTLSVFLSQRRRWTLGATGNDLMLLVESKWNFNLWERIVALSNCLTWILNFFVIASLGCMIYAFMHQPAWVILIFASIMIIPLTFYFCMVFWLCRTWIERWQFLLGLSIFTTLGPFINICVTVYACIYMDNFGWGKTRKVIAETGEAEEPDWQAQHDRFEDALNNDEKIVGTLVPDEENQLDPTVYRTPFTVPTPDPSRLHSRNPSYNIQPPTPPEMVEPAPKPTHLQVPGTFITDSRTADYYLTRPAPTHLPPHVLHDIEKAT